jgi:hypothetical protein
MQSKPVPPILLQCPVIPQVTFWRRRAQIIIDRLMTRRSLVCAEAELVQPLGTAAGPSQVRVLALQYLDLPVIVTSDHVLLDASKQNLYSRGGCGSSHSFLYI